MAAIASIVTVCCWSVCRETYARARARDILTDPPTNEKSPPFTCVPLPLHSSQRQTRKATDDAIRLTSRPQRSLRRHWLLQTRKRRKNATPVTQKRALFSRLSRRIETGICWQLNRRHVRDACNKCGATSDGRLGGNAAATSSEHAPRPELISVAAINNSSPASIVTLLLPSGRPPLQRARTLSERRRRALSDTTFSFR